MEGFELKNITEAPKKRDGYAFSEFDINEFKKLEVGNRVEFMEDGKVVSGVVEEINSINEIKVLVPMGEGTETFSYGTNPTLSFEDIKFIESK